MNIRLLRIAIFSLCLGQVPGFYILGAGVKLGRIILVGSVAWQRDGRRSPSKVRMALMSSESSPSTR